MCETKKTANQWEPPTFYLWSPSKKLEAWQVSSAWELHVHAGRLPIWGLEKSDGSCSGCSWIRRQPNLAFGAEPGAWEGTMAERACCYSVETGDGMEAHEELGQGMTIWYFRVRERGRPQDEYKNGLRASRFAFSKAKYIGTKRTS